MRNLPFHCEPHLFYAEVSLDISCEAFHSALDKLEEGRELFGRTYLFNLLRAKALQGTGDFFGAQQCLQQCCTIAPTNQVAWNALLHLRARAATATTAVQYNDPVTAELEELSAALMQFEPLAAAETSDPTPIIEQKMPFPDDASIAAPTETLATLFTRQGAFKKAIKVYSMLIRLHPEQAEGYQQEIESLLEKL